MGFKTFLAIYLSIMIAVSTFVVLAVPRLQTQNEAVSSNHFSVRWMGFVPTYSSQYPEYYVCINNLANDPMPLQIALQIKNQENRSFYFRIEANGTPPSGWSLPQYDIGLINKDETKTFAYSAFRTNPATISQGRLTEVISLIVKAFYDPGYVQQYSQDSFSVTYNFLDRTAPDWTIVYYDSFDDGQTHQWTAVTEGGGVAGNELYASTDYYRSFQTSLKLRLNVNAYGGNAGYKKSFDIAGTFSEAYLVYSVRSENWVSKGIELNGVKYFEPDVSPSTNTWYQVAIRMPTGNVTEVRIWTVAGVYAQWRSSYLDDVYVVAK